MGNLGYYYEYDVMGNITKVRSGPRKSGTDQIDYDRTDATYAYDSKGQLVRENNNTSGQTVTYEYDAGGNLKTKKIYAYTTATDLSIKEPTKTIDYTYDSTWKDQLLSYDGDAITYDGIGNPLTYRGATLDWRGRELKSLTKDGTTISYVYGTDGLRTKKTVGNEVHEYYYSGGKLAYEKRGAEEYYYIYDFEGNLSRIGHFDASGTRTVYYPVTNVRGDVQAIFDASGNLKAEYTYDAWGNVTEIKDASGADISDQSNIGHLNRIRYRGYYYDVETGFYYVSSRYYDPEVGRFLNADDTDILEVQSDLYDKNLYAYCDNNPVMRKDTTGEVWDTALDIAFIAGDIASIIANPTNVVGYAELAADVVGLAVPGLTGGGKIVRAVMNSDNVLKASKVADKIVDSKQAIKSSRKLGTKIHKSYDPIKKTVAKKYKSVNKSLKKYGSKLRPDAIDFKNRIIYELKPYNKTSYNRALRQANTYAKILGGKWNIVIDMYR